MPERGVAALSARARCTHRHCASSDASGSGLPKVTIDAKLGIDVADFLDLDTPPIINKPVF
jgi:hypothetical protein